jgi:hypothetical protein
MAFASIDDIAARLEETALSAVAQVSATQLIATATAIICQAAGETDDDWFDDLTSVEQDLVKGLTIDLVCRAMASPQGLVSATETLGAYERSEAYRRDPSSALLLTPQEEALVARIVGRTGSGSVRVESLVHDVYVTEE